jgi:hypothetical protein
MFVTLIASQLLKRCITFPYKKSALHVGERLYLILGVLGTLYHFAYGDEIVLGAITSTESGRGCVIVADTGEGLTNAIEGVAGTCTVSADS